MSSYFKTLTGLAFVHIPDDLIEAKRAHVKLTSLIKEIRNGKIRIESKNP